MDTIGSSTYKKIKRDIIFGELKPSSKLKLDEIKKKYPVSLSTIRETLNRLSSEGFVVAEEQRGFYVSSFSKKDLIEIAKLRILLESYALNLSLKNGDTDWEGNLVAAHHKLSLIENKMDNKNKEIVESWKKYDWEFHLACIAACGSQNLMTLHSNLFDRYLRYQIILLQFRGEEAIDEHNQIYNFSIERDAENAIKYLKIHIEKGLEHALDLFQD